MAYITDLPTLYRAEDVILTFTLTPATNVTNWTFRFVLVDPADESILFEKTSGAGIQTTDAPGGVVTVTLDAADLNLINRTYRFELARTDDGASTELARGRFPVALAQATQGSGPVGGGGTGGIDHAFLNHLAYADAGHTGFVPDIRQVIAGVGLEGGGPLNADITLTMPDVGVPGTYGSTTTVPVITTDAQGRVSSVSTATVAAGPASSQTFSYRFNANTTPPPASGDVRLNNTTQTLATTVYAHRMTNSGNDARNYLMQTQVGSRVYLQDEDNADAYQTYQVTQAPTDQGNYVSIPVTWLSGGTSVPAQPCILALLPAPPSTRPDGSWAPPSLADSAAQNNSVYYSTTASKLVYKSAVGTVFPLY